MIAEPCSSIMKKKEQTTIELFVAKNTHHAMDNMDGLAQVCNALGVMLNPKSPTAAKESSDWLQEFRNDNEPRRRRTKHQSSGKHKCWPTLMTLLTQADANDGERLFAAQAILYRVRKLTQY